MLRLDSPKPYQWWFQDGANWVTNSMHDLHNLINYYLLLILVAVLYIITITVISSSSLSSKYLTHGKLIEFIWTVSPALLLILIAYPSFRLLYLLDSVNEPSLTIKVMGHQWFWSVELSDYVTINNESIIFDSYIVPTENLINGEPRLLEVDNPLVLPVDTNIRFIVSSVDVIHDLAIPSLGIKIDAVPGRLNQFSTSINRLGRYYGQCSELCGSEHAFMPFCIQSVTLDRYLLWLSSM